LSDKIMILYYVSRPRCWCNCSLAESSCGIQRFIVNCGDAVVNWRG